MHSDRLGSADIIVKPHREISQSGPYTFLIKNGRLARLVVVAGSVFSLGMVPWLVCCENLWISGDEASFSAFDLIIIHQNS